MVWWEDMIVLRYMRAVKWLPALLLLANCKSKAPQSQQDALPFYNNADFTAEWINPDDRRYSAIHTIDTFSLTDQHGHIINSSALRGRIYTANFFFTACPGICPKMTANLLTIQKAFAGDSQVLILSFSVTPAKDSVAVLRQYAADKGITSAQWHLLTGNEQRIYTLARQSYFAEKTLGLKKDKDEFLHTESVLLIDGQGRIRGIYNATQPMDMERIIEDIRILKKLG